MTMQATITREENSKTSLFFMIILVLHCSLDIFLYSIQLCHYYAVQLYSGGCQVID